MKILKHVAVGLLALVCAAYLLNPGAGVFELLPDNIPFLGNLDEATATALLVMCLAYFGIDVSRFVRKR